MWGGRWDLNPRHSEPQSDALPTELRPPHCDAIFCEIRTYANPDRPQFTTILCDFRFLADVWAIAPALVPDALPRLLEFGSALDCA
jgi:hypothetical protein